MVGGGGGGVGGVGFRTASSTDSSRSSCVLLGNMAVQSSSICENDLFLESASSGDVFLDFGFEATRCNGRLVVGDACCCTVAIPIVFSSVS